MLVRRQNLQLLKHKLAMHHCDSIFASENKHLLIQQLVKEGCHLGVLSSLHLQDERLLQLSKVELKYVI